MKKILPLLMLFTCLVSCKTPCPDLSIPAPLVLKDTVVLDFDYKAKNDSLSIVILKLEQTVTDQNEINRKLASELLNERLVIENAKYYVNIVNKNRSQEKFLLGWMNRALNN